MPESKHPTCNKFICMARKIYNPIGFQKGYNFLLWFICMGYILGFTGARLPYLDLRGYMCDRNNPAGAGPSECYWYLFYRRYEVGILMHLGAILFASIFAVFQFTPVIRHKFPLYHRMAGYLTILLILVSNAGALVIADRAFGGHLSTQVLTGLLAIITTGCLVISLYNIKRLQIDQHRAWMIRCWAYLTTIITLRVTLTVITAIQPSYPLATWEVFPCEKLQYIVNNDGLFGSRYPQCFDQNGTVIAEKYSAVEANLRGGGADYATAAVGTAFAPSSIIAIFLHLVGSELYLWLTPKEKERLRNVSYHRQVEAGMGKPRSMGTESDAIPWVPAEKRPVLNEKESESSG